MILDYLYSLFGTPNSDVERVLYLAFAGYLVIYLLKLVMTSVFRIIGIRERRY